MKEIEEVWKPLAPFTKTYKGVTIKYDLSDTYEISNTGKIRHKHSGRERKLRINNSGYPYVMLCKDGKKLNCKVHRLVAQTFLENTENKETVNHIDGNKTNNNVDNLEWATRSENTQHAFANGLINIKGEQNHNSKLTKFKVIEIRERRVTNPKLWTQSKLAKEYGVDRSQISRIIHRKTWAHV